MNMVHVSTKYQIVIPKEVRERFGIKPGQEISYIVKGGIIHLVPVQPITSMRGFLQGKGITLDNIREKQDRAI